MSRPRRAVLYSARSGGHVGGRWLASPLLQEEMTMRLGRLWSSLALALLVMLTAGASIAPAQSASTLVVGLVAEPVGLDPAQVTDLNSSRVGRRVVETLVGFADESTQIVPLLAESWTISKDGLTYTFKLRKGIAFHDGTPFNAQAVKFSIERQINPEHPANKLGKYPFAAYFFGNVKAVEAMDESTVRFVLKEPRASFLAILVAPAASIVSPTAAMKSGQDYAVSPVGTGPFKFVSWDRGQRVVLEKNPSYWRYPVKVDRVIYRPVTEDQARLTELLTGGLDLIVGTPPDFVAQLENHPKVTLQKQVGAHVWYLGFNNTKKPFDDKRVRQALNYAVNKDAIVRDVLKGTGSISKGPVLPGTWGDEGGLKPFPYDPERAKKLLADAGLPSGFSTTLWVPESGSGMQSPVAMSTIIQSNLKAVAATASRGSPP
jgi:peptide/nickel transport system substrate-binding protein